MVLILPDKRTEFLACYHACYFRVWIRNVMLSVEYGNLQSICEELNVFKSDNFRSGISANEV